PSRLESQPEYPPTDAQTLVDREPEEFARHVRCPKACLSFHREPAKIRIQETKASRKPLSCRDKSDERHSKAMSWPAPTECTAGPPSFRNADEYGRLTKQLLSWPQRRC